jgi:hypothetical protein
MVNPRGEEFLRLAAALDDILDRRIGPSPNGTREGIFVAIAGKLNAQALLGAMNPDRERDKLRKVARLARELGQAWEDLHDDVRCEMAEESTRLDGDASLHLFKVLDELPKLIGRVDRAAHGLIKAAPIAGRSDLRSIAIINTLRDIWQERKGAPAPKNISDTGPFTDLVREIFEALSVRTNPRSAMDSWRKFSLKTKIRDWLGIQS